MKQHPKVESDCNHVTGGVLHAVERVVQIAHRFVDESKETSAPLSFKEALELAIKLESAMSMRR